MTTFLSDIFDSFKKLLLLLGQSLTSPHFYQNVFFNFSGYGIKFLFTLSYIASVIVVILLIQKIEPLKTYFETRKVTTSATLVVDTIVNNWESFEYDGKYISNDNAEPTIITGPNKRALVAVDAKDQLAGSIKKNIPIIFGKSKLILATGDTLTGDHQISLDYRDVFGNIEGKLSVNAELIINMLAEYCKYLDKMLIYIFFPTLILLNLFTISIEKILMVLMLYLVLRLFVNLKTTVKSVIRLIAFSCGSTALLLPLAFVSEIFGQVANISNIWTSFLIIYFLTTLKKQAGAKDIF